MQQIPLLQSKLYVPPIRPELVSRPRLIERLNNGLYRKLTLISAPAGFGKTTLASEWLACLRLAAAGKSQNVHGTAWLSLDESDNDLARFLTYFVAALQAVEPRLESAGKLGKGTLSALQSSQLPPTEDLLTHLINEIAAIPDRIVLVLDDYHLIESRSIHEALTFLLQHLPPQMHLAIATREDPHLPLARLRARGQLSELRVSDLRFAPSEAAVFFDQVMGLHLSAEEVASLETRTEGWIAGLQLVALALQGLALQGTLSMQGRADTASFIQAFTGSHRFVLDYLVEEVLQRQPEHVRSFLLQTSILDRLSGPLCDAVCLGLAETPNRSVRAAGPEGEARSFGTAARFGSAKSRTGQQDSKGMLEVLERGNLFVVPLDDNRQWYRYHHLFAHVLQAYLMEEQPNQVPALHLRASEWYEQNGLPSDAFRHALAAEDFGRAAGVAELAWQAMDDSFQSAAWLGWVRNLPDELIRSRPVLSTQYAWALWMGGELEASETRLRDAERWLDAGVDTSARPEGPADGMVVVDKKRFRTLPASIALVRAYNAQSQGDVSATAKYTELALKLTPEEDHLGRAQATVSLGFTYWVSGDLEAAHKALAGWIDSMQKAGNIVFAIASTYALADIMVAQGRLQEAARAYKQSLQLAAEHDEHVQRVVAHLYLGLAMLYHEMGDQEATAQHLLKCQELGKQSTLPDWPYRWCLAQAQLKESRGDLEAALDLLDEAKRLYVRSSLPDMHPIEALKARLYVRQGRLPRALAWAHEQGLSVDDEISYLCEFEHITLARVLIAKASSPIAQYKSNRAERSVLQAIGLLERLLKAAEEGRRRGSVIEILMLQALAHQAQGNIPDAPDPLERALAPLERALTLAEPEGYVRIFVDEGPPMARLLKQLYRKGVTVDYIAQILAAYETTDDRRPTTAGEPPDRASSVVRRPTSPPAGDATGRLVDPLSKRELEVLELLGTELNGPEIARELVVSLATIRTHTQNIYSKLGVNNRRAAVRRAEELDLL